MESLLIALVLLALLARWAWVRDRRQRGLPVKPWFGWSGRTQRRRPASLSGSSQPQTAPRAIKVDPRSRAAQGKTGRISKAEPRSSPPTPIPDAMPTKAPLPPRPKWAEQPTPKPPPQAISPQMLIPLNRLTRDPEVSMRLVRRVQALNPERDVHWCVKKTLWDLERDRK